MRAWLLVASIPTLSLIFPLLLFACPSFFRPLFFGNFIRDYDDFKLLKGVKTHGRNFYLDGEEGRLGCWHILPKTLSAAVEYGKFSDKEVEQTMTTSNYTIVVYLHGLGHSRGWYNRVDTYNVLAAMDLHVLTLDYRGYGDSGGYPSESGIINDSIALFDYVMKMAGKNHVFLWGHSLGSGVATAAAMELTVRKSPLPAGLILEAPFNNAVDAIVESPESAAWRWTPWFNALVKRTIPLAGINFSSDLNIKVVSCPILILHAVDDEAIPIVLAQKLRDAALSGGRDVTFVAFPAGLGLFHKHINKASELPLVLKRFMNHCAGSSIHLKIGEKVRYLDYAISENDHGYLFL